MVDFDGIRKRAQAFYRRGDANSVHDRALQNLAEKLEELEPTPEEKPAEDLGDPFVCCDGAVLSDDDVKKLGI